MTKKKEDTKEQEDKIVKQKTKKKSKTKRNITSGIAFVQSTFNNTMELSEVSRVLITTHR